MISRSYIKNTSNRGDQEILLILKKICNIMIMLYYVLSFLQRLHKLIYPHLLTGCFMKFLYSA